MIQDVFTHIWGAKDIGSQLVCKRRDRKPEALLRGLIDSWATRGTKQIAAGKDNWAEHFQKQVAKQDVDNDPIFAF